MLYITTRNKTDSYTAKRVLQQGIAPDGGQYVPMNLPKFSTKEISEMQEKSFGQIVAQILNLFFSTELNGCDIDFGVGRYPFKLKDLGSKIHVAETWHNLDNNYDRFISCLYGMLCPNLAGDGVSTGWGRIAIRIATLFGLYGELAKGGVTCFDISAACGDFETPAAAWYAREMGLPIDTIICGCDENGAAWDLFHRGQYNTASVTPCEYLPNLNVKTPVGIERLIFGTLGLDENLRYLKTVENHGLYTLYEEFLDSLNRGIYAAVIGKDRISTVINSVYRNNTYVIDPFVAISFGAVQDFRARTGENRPTLLLAEQDPMRFGDVLGLSEKDLKNYVP